MGLLLSWIIARRWLTLIGIAVCLAAAAIGNLTRSGVVTAIMLAIGVLLLLAQVVVSVIRNVRAIREGQPPRF